jgi:hypothetical protein
LRAFVFGGDKQKNGPPPLVDTMDRLAPECGRAGENVLLEGMPVCAPAACAPMPPATMPRAGMRGSMHPGRMQACALLCASVLAVWCP